MKHDVTLQCLISHTYRMPVALVPTSGCWRVSLFEALAQCWALSKQCMLAIILIKTTVFWVHGMNSILSSLLNSSVRRVINVLIPLSQLSKLRHRELNLPNSYEVVGKEGPISCLPDSRSCAWDVMEQGDLPAKCEIWPPKFTFFLERSRIQAAFRNISADSWVSRDVPSLLHVLFHCPRPSCPCTFRWCPEASSQPLAAPQGLHASSCL